VDTPYRTEARIEPRTSATAHVTLYCTWRPSDLTTGLHGQVALKVTYRLTSTRKDHPLASSSLDPPADFCLCRL